MSAATDHFDRNDQDFGVSAVPEPAEVQSNTGRRQKGCRLAGQGFSIWRESRVAVATAILSQERKVKRSRQ